MSAGAVLLNAVTSWGERKKKKGGDEERGREQQSEEEDDNNDNNDKKCKSLDSTFRKDGGQGSLLRSMVSMMW